VLGGIPDGTVLLLLVVTTAITIPMALLAFRWFMLRARQSGILDMITGT
jgi:hypothetical protein